MFRLMSWWGEGNLKMTTEKHNKIAKLAYRFYLRRGCRDGYALDDWLKAEKTIFTKIWFKDGFFKFLRHPLLLIFFSGFGIWILQQQFIKNEELLKKKFEVTKTILPVHASYSQEIWNHWFAFQNKTPSEKYRANIQRIVVEAKGIETQIPILFKDKKIYEDRKQLLHIFWEANYPISRERISEQQLNEKLNLAAPLIDDTEK